MCTILGPGDNCKQNKEPVFKEFTFQLENNNQVINIRHMYENKCCEAK